MVTYLSIWRGYNHNASGWLLRLVSVAGALLSRSALLDDDGGFLSFLFVHDHTVIHPLTHQNCVSLKKT